MAKNTKNLLVASMFDDANIFDNPFSNDKDRIKYITKKYANMSIGEAFAKFYGTTISKEIKSNEAINTVQTLEIGSHYIGKVKEIHNNRITFDVYGVKEEVYSRENFGNCIDAINNYLLTHDNKLLFKVQAKEKDKWLVDIKNAYYDLWKNSIEHAIKDETPIKAHIDDLVRGGYICHTEITTLCDLTGQPYTHSVFIPGSQIVLNIERDFERWIGKDVEIIPQKLVEYKRNMRTGEVENSLVVSRKKLLQVKGTKNLNYLYSKWKLGNKEGFTYTPEAYEATVTGIINSNKKTGVFVELDDLCITGLVPVDSSELFDFHPGDTVRVVVNEFETQEGRDPFVYNKRGDIVRCNVRVVFRLA